MSGWTVAIGEEEMIVTSPDGSVHFMSLWESIKLHCELLRKGDEGLVLQDD